MHLYIVARGIKHDLDQFITELQGKYLPFKWRNEKAGEKELRDMNIQLGVRPIQLYEIAFPEEHKDLILTTILGNCEQAGKPQHKWQNKFVYFLRKMLKLDPIPEYKKDFQLPVWKNNLEIVGIGLKPDYWVDKDGKHIDHKEEGAFEGI